MKQLYTLRAVGRRAVALALSAVLAVTCVSLAPLGPASAQEESPDTASQSDAPEIKTVRVGWLLNNQGFQNGMPGEYMSGWGYEYLQALSYYTPGWKYEYVPGTFPELIQKLEDGEIDLMPNISYTPERAEKLLYSSNPQGVEHYYIFAKPTNDALGTGDPAALNGMTIGVNPDVMQTEVGKQWIENQGISCDYRYYSSGNALFDALSSGEVDAIIKSEGERAVLETGIRGLHPELVKMLGRLHYRTSYGQNVLQHSIEVSHLAGMMAAELGADVYAAKRAGLLHDIGKAVDHEMEGTHVALGVEFLRKYHEKDDIIHAVQAHHNDVEPQTIVACLVQAADAISAARPGARRENLENYIKRLEQLEEITGSYPGVDKAYAIQAGREVRVMVKPDQVSEDQMVILARELAKKIEEEMEYPGQIKVHVLRETTAIEYAK